MELKLLNTPNGLIPMYDEDYDERKKLRLGQIYKANISTIRNISFHNKYFQLISVAWNYMTEKQRRFFHDNMDSFRKAIQVDAGYFDLVYSIKRKEWLEMPRSISFASMDNAAFEEVYNRVFDALMRTVFSKMSREEFESILERF